MSSYGDLNITLALFLVVLTIALIWCYKKYVGVYSDFPTVNFFSACFKLIFMSNTTKNIPVTSFFFQYAIGLCKQFQSEGLYLLWILWPYLVIFNADAYKIFTNDQSSVDKPFNFDIFKEYWGTSLLTCSGDLYKKRRKMLNPLFYKSMLRDKVQMVNKNAVILIKQLMELPLEEPVIPMKQLKLCAYMNVYEYLSGLDCNKEENYPEIEYFIDTVTKSTEMTITRVFKPWLHPRFTMLTFAKGREFLKRIREAHLLGAKQLKKMKNSTLNVEKNKEKENDEDYKATRLTFAQLINEYHLKDPTFTPQDAHDELAGLMTAGYDTVSYGLMWSLFVLGHHSEIQERLFEEVDSFMETRDTLSDDDLQNMKYLERVIKEILRLYPPIPLFARYLSKDVKCGKYTVPKGTNLVFLLYESGRDPKLFPDPEKFDPDRFLVENSEKTLLTWTFAEGTRNCIGKHFALMELKIVLAHLIKNFRVTSLDDPKDINLSWEVVLTTVEPLRFRLTPRCHDSVQ